MPSTVPAGVARTRTLEPATPTWGQIKPSKPSQVGPSQSVIPSQAGASPCPWLGPGPWTPRAHLGCAPNGRGAEKDLGRAPQGALRRPNQSHWISSPAGWSISMVSLPFIPRTPRSGDEGPNPDLADEARIARADDLVVEGAGPDVAVVAELEPDVVLDPGQRIGDRASAHPRLALLAQIPRTVLRLRPRWRAMADIDHTRSRRACASTPSPCVSMWGGSVRAGRRREPPASGGLARVGGPSGPTRRSRVGIAVIVSRSLKSRRHPCHPLAPKQDHRLLFSICGPGPAQLYDSIRAVTCRPAHDHRSSQAARKDPSA